MSSIDQKHQGKKRHLVAAITALLAAPLAGFSAGANAVVADAPVLTLSQGNTVLNGGPEIVVDGGLTVTNNNPEVPLDGAVVVISKGFLAGDALSFTAVEGITGSYDSNTGILTFTGLGTDTAYQAVLRSVKFSSNTKGEAREIVFSLGTAVPFKPCGSSTYHYYESVAENLSWTAAKAAAEARSNQGLAGYLTTITCQDEQDFTVSKLPNTGAWIGASDAAVEGDWLWVTGPEAGTLFYRGQGASGASVEGRFAEWSPDFGGQPDNVSGGTEHYAQAFFNLGNPPTKWNDLPESGAGFTSRYLVEYGGFEGDTDSFTAAKRLVPPSAALSASGGATPSKGIYDAVVDANLTVSENGQTTLDGAVVNFGSGFVAGDTLGFTAAGGITGSYDAEKGVLTLTGEGSTAEYQDVLRSVTFTTTSGTGGNREILFSLGSLPPFKPCGHNEYHYYDFVSDPGRIWLDAKNRAEAQTHFGLQGYLTTVGCAAEHEFALNEGHSAGKDIVWIGASARAKLGDWFWVTGPEGEANAKAGTEFYIAGQGPVNEQYSPWGDGEPNTGGGTENVAHFWSNLGGKANDNNETSGSSGYAVEYGGFEGEANTLTGAKTVAVSIAPTEPSNATASEVHSTQVTVSWQDNSTNETGFKIYNSADPQNPIATVGANETSVVIPGLSCSTEYQYTVTAYLESESLGATTMTVKTAPCAPTPVTAVKKHAGKVYLSWQDNSTDENLFKVFVDGGETPAVQTAADVTSSVFRPIACGDHTFVVKATRNSDHLDSDAASTEVVNIPCLTPDFKSESIPTRLSSEWQHYASNEVYDKPVIIVAPPSNRDAQPGVVRVRNVGSGFDIRFQPWGDGDPAHAKIESASALLLESGRHVLADGSVWEVGTFNLGVSRKEGNKATKTFISPFDKAPKVFLTVQTANGENAVTARLKSVNKKQFVAVLQEQEANRKREHVAETIGYLAIYTPSVDNSNKRDQPGSGVLIMSDQLDHPYSVDKAVAKRKDASVLSTPVTEFANCKLRVVEDDSKDAENKHANVFVSTLFFDAQYEQYVHGQLWFQGQNPASLRSLSCYEDNEIVEEGENK